MEFLNIWSIDAGDGPFTYPKAWGTLGGTLGGTPGEAYVAQASLGGHLGPSPHIPSPPKKQRVK